MRTKLKELGFTEEQIEKITDVFRNHNKYNGWTNWETWVANLWLTNDEKTYELTRSCINIGELKATIENLVFDNLKSDSCETAKTGLSVDVLQGFLKEINYDELYDSLQED